VFVEVLAYFSEGGSFARRRAVDLVDGARSDRRTTVLPQTPRCSMRASTFTAGGSTRGTASPTACRWPSAGSGTHAGA